MNREKVIKGLECCTTGCCRECPYFDEECCLNDFLQRDALELLKEHEAVEPTWQQGKAYCGSCGKRIPMKIGARYCHKCGKAVKWE